MLGITILRVVNVVLVGYLLLLSLRIVLSWFQASLYGRPWALLQRVTDPYLGLFRRLPFLRQGTFDLSPVAAVLVIVVILDLVNELLSFGEITLGYVLGSVLGALWYGAGFLLLLFALLCALRLVGFGLRTARNPALWKALDAMVQPVVGWMARLLGRSVRFGYVQTLAITAAALFTVWFLGGMGVRVLVRVLRALPI